MMGTKKNFNMKKITFLSIDLQKDFSAQGGKKTLLFYITGFYVLHLYFKIIQI